MFNKIVVGVDGREGGSDAVALAQTLAAPDAEIVLVNAFRFDPYPDLMLNITKDSLRADALKLLDIEEDDPRVERQVVPDTSPGRALHHVAEDVEAELIVVGSSHRGPVGRVLVGSVGRAVTHGATCPVAIAPHGYAKTGGRARIVGVGVDHSQEAQAAVQFAERLAKQREGELRMLSVTRLPAAIASGYGVGYAWPEVGAENRKAAEKLLAQTKERLDVPAMTEVVEGTAGEELDAFSRSVDVLVLGSRGWGAVKRVVLGSTSDHVAQHAACPVILVPSPKSEATERADHDDLAVAS